MKYVLIILLLNWEFIEMARKGARQAVKHFQRIEEAHDAAIDQEVKKPLIIIKPQRAVRLIKISENVVRRDRRYKK